MVAACQLPHLPPKTEPDPTGEESGPGRPTESPGGGPSIAIADVRAGEAGGALRFTVTPSRAGPRPITVAYATEDGTARGGHDFQPARGTLRFPAESAVAQQIAIVVLDDSIAEQSETFTVRLSDPQGATLAVPTATGTIVDDDDVRSVTVEPSALNVPEGGSATYTVALGSQPTGAVTVTVTAVFAELTVRPERLRFTAVDWRAPRALTVTAAPDLDALADPPTPITHTASGGGYGGAWPAVTVTIVERDVATLAIAESRASERDGTIGFTVTLNVPSDEVVTVDYVTGAATDTASAGQDYAHGRGTLRFAARSTAAQTIKVTLLDDVLDEPDEKLTVTLSNPAHAELAGGGDTAAATGTIADDDPPPQVSIADGSATEGTGDGNMRFAVRLFPASGRTATVQYATADLTAVAGVDYTAVSGTLTFRAGTTSRTIAVPVLTDGTVEPDETFSVRLSVPTAARLLDAEATGSITDDNIVAAPDGASLQVSGGASDMYPAFNASTRHYAVRCGDSTTLRVTARAPRSDVQLTLLRADESANQVATGSLDTSISVSGDHDIAIEFSDARETTTYTYVVHCIPAEFPDITVQVKTAQVTDGLLLMTPRYGHSNPVGFMAIVDNNGVPRYHRKLTVSGKKEGANFRRHGAGRYSFTRRHTGRKTVELLDDQLEVRATVGVVSPLSSTDFHDFLMTDEGNRLFISYHASTRDFCAHEPDCEEGGTRQRFVRDSVIQEVTPAGEQVFLWNSWDHIKISDCTVIDYPDEYSHLNSLHLVDGDIVASFRGCAQVLRIDRSGGTGAVEWQLGGTAPPRNPATAYLQIVGDSAGEICGQHSAVINSTGNVVLFDNGNHCLGPRKQSPTFTRVVEYDISSGTQAWFVREYRLPPEYGSSWIMGAVSILDNGRWLITWGGGLFGTSTMSKAGLPSVSEVDPATGTVHFQMNMYLAHGNRYGTTYRVYREREADVRIPLNLP